MIILPPDLELLQGYPTPFDAPPGSHVKSAYAYVPYFTLQDGDPVNTFRMDFVAAGSIGISLLHDVMEWVKGELPAWGEELLAYSFHEQTVFDISVPDQFCLGDSCWVPPFAGQNIITGYQYRLWLLSRDLPPPAAPLAARAMGALAVLAIVGGIIVGITLLVGIIKMWTGEITWREIRSFTQDVLKAPGENIAAPIGQATWPLAAMGFALAATAVTIPWIAMKGGVTVPIGPARVEAEVRTPSGVPRARRR